MAGLSSLFMSIFFIVPAFSASFSFCAIQVSVVDVWESFWIVLYLCSTILWFDFSASKIY